MGFSLSEGPSPQGLEQDVWSGEEGDETNFTDPAAIPHSACAQLHDGRSRGTGRAHFRLSAFSLELDSVNRA